MELTPKDQVDIMNHLVQASIDVEKLKPHVGDEQYEAAQRIKNHLNTIANIVSKNILKY